MTKTTTRPKDYQPRGGTRSRMDIGMRDIDVHRMAQLGYFHQQLTGRAPSQSVIVSKALEVAAKLLNTANAGLSAGGTI